MTPTPQEHILTEQNVEAPVMNRDRIVISGMSGLYPRSHNIKEFAEILYNKENPILSADMRWKFNHPEMAQHAGQIPGVDRFDAQFFKVHRRLGNNMDPMSRKILEQAHNAIYDAGVGLEQVSGKKVGVFVGSAFSESEKTFYYDATSRSGYGIAGCNKAMFANRISYWLDAKGPSMSIDEACCSSAAALEQAYLAMSRGDCEAAIVGGAFLCLHPHSSVHYGRIIKKAMDGKTKSFDENADGIVVSEAINVLFLQKSKDALRVYAELLHAKTEYIGVLQGEAGSEYGFLRSSDSTVNFLKSFYEEARIPPQAVKYVEAFGSAIPDADKAELEAIDKVICKEKDNQLLVGSVTSNIGYCEAASGIASVTKVLLGYHTGQLAANLHCEHQRQDVEALREGRIKIVTDHERFDRSYTAVNGMSVTGINSHALLYGHYKPKDLSRYKSNIPHLVTLSARQDTVVTKIIEDLTSRPIDPEELALFHNIHQTNVVEYLGRGYVVLDTNEEQKTVSLSQNATYFDESRRPLWFVYSGMGSQWAGMGAQLMRIPIFAAAIEKCRQVLEPKGLDIVHIITTDDDKIFDNILHSFVGIAAVQIGLTDILRELGLVPDGIIGHSVGELGCSYADGCLTAEETILSAYSRGLVSLQTPFIRGSMAAVGLGYEKISKLIPPEIEVACHNGPESSTISGPSDIMREFVAELTAKGIFAKEVPCSNIAYHSRYIADAGPALLKYLKQVIKTPKQRSDRWVSTSIPKNRWNEDLAQFCSAEYHTNNLLCPVLFEETLPQIPANAVLVEVAPHGLLQAILKRSLPGNCQHIALTRRKHPDNALLFLEAVGKLYMAGYSPKVQVLYPKVEMPVSTGTPFLSHHFEWAHGEKWDTAFYEAACRKQASSCNWMVSLYDKENQYLEGYVFRNKTVYPSSATLVAVWDTLAMIMGVPKKKLSVRFQDVMFYVQPVLHEQTQLRIRVQIERGTGNFEVLDENILIASGCITADNSRSINKSILEKQVNDNDEIMTFTAADIYHLLHERDYSYSGQFCCIERANATLTKAELEWRNNWVTCIDSLFQLNALHQAHDIIPQPKHFRKLHIDVKEHYNAVNVVTGDKNLLKAEVNTKYDITRCGGILIEDIRYHNIPPTTDSKIEFQTLKFVENGQTAQHIATSLQVYLQIVAENMNKTILKIVGLTNDSSAGSVFEQIQNIGTNVFGVTIEYEQIDIESSIDNVTLFNEADVVISSNLSTNNNVCELLHHLLRPDTLLINEEHEILGNRVRPSSLYKVLFTLSGDHNAQSLQLVRWRPTPSVPVATTVTIHTPSDYTLLRSARDNLPANRRLLVFTTYPAPANLKNLVQAWRKEAERNLIQLIMVNDDSSEIFLNDLPDIDLVFSVVDQCKWGGEYYCPVQDEINSNNVMLKLLQVGDVESLYWMKAPEVKRNEHTVKVHYASIGNADVKKANGTILFEKDADNCFGMDFSGITPNGERVMGIVRGGAASSEVRAVPELLWPVPAHWSLEDAATVPLAYINALYCLVFKFELYPGNSFLIHGGCGATGQAAIAIALSMGCKVFTTVSDIRKKEFLRKLFPELKEECIGNSRDDSFADMVLNGTNGEGCSFVISNVKEDLKNASCKSAGHCGRVIDLSQLHNREHFVYGMNYLTRNRAYAIIDLSSIFKTENINILKTLHIMLSEGIARGYVRPLSRVTYAPLEVARAFHLLEESHHRGRVLLRMTDNTPCTQYNRISCNPDLTQLILYQQEEFGLQFADRLVDRGATKLHLHYEDQLSAKLQFKIRSWERNGVKVQISSGNLNSVNVVNLVNNAQQLGLLQGIYLVIGGDSNVDESLLMDLDSVSRKMCPSLRYFAIINSNNTMIGHSTCIHRARSQLPATILSLAELNTGSNASWRDSLDAVEHALGVSDAVLKVRAVHQKEPTLLQKIAALAGITITQSTPKTATLEDLGIKDDKLNSIAAFLRAYYSMSLKDTEIPNLTLNTISRLENSEVNFEDIKGLGAFFSRTDSDELMATTEIMALPTFTSAALRADEFDDTQTYLCIVPGMEGHYEKFQGLCERLKVSAFVLQPGLDHPHETVSETAKRFTELLLKKTVKREDFYLLGYESGVLVALEMAKILEEQGRTGTVYCIGFAPDELKTVIEESLSEYTTEEQLQDALVKHMFKLMVDKDPVELNKALENAKTWSQKVDICVSFLRGHVSQSMQYVSAFMEAALARISRVRRWRGAAHALRSRVLLLRAAAAHAPPAATCLQQHSLQPVVERQLRAPLGRAPDDTRCAAFINQYLHPDILTAYENGNNCDSYLVNPNGFMNKKIVSDK